jgi:DNA-binding response OmpR family regulator
MALTILVVEDEADLLRGLRDNLSYEGYRVLTATDGEKGLSLAMKEKPDLVILDWMMPGMDGVDVIRRIRANAAVLPPYLILLTAKDRVEDIVEGLQAGADDYITKPFEREELLARVQVGTRVLQLQASLAERVADLEEALRQVRRLQGLLPICSYCKRVRNDKDYWQQVESYVMEHSEARFSHGICPDCYERVVKPQLADIRDSGR